MPGDTATISSGGTVVDGLTLDGLTISLGSAGATLSSGTVALSASGVTTTPSTDITVAVGGAAVLVLSGAVANSGTITDSGPGTTLVQSGALANAGSILVSGGATYAMAGTLTNDGTIVVNGGTLVVGGASTLNGSAGGPGAPALTEVGGGGTVVGFGLVASSQSLAFTDGTGVLDLGSPTNFHGTITAMQAGDYIDLPSVIATSAVLSGGFITVSGITDSGTSGTIVRLNTTLSNNALQFTERATGFGTLLLTSDQTRIWNANSGNWTNAADWTTSGVAGAGAPLPGDELFIDSGTATLDAQAGVVRASVIHLDGKSFFSPGTLLLQSATLDKTTTVVVDGSGTAGQLLVSGTDVLGGTVSAAAINGFLVVDGADPGGAADCMVVVSGAIVAAEGAGVAFTSVTVQNDGLIDGYGGLSFDASVTINGSGILLVEDAGTLSIGGTVGGGQVVSFGGDQGTLQIGNLSAFGAAIQNDQQGDVIDLLGMSGVSGSYADGTLSLTVSSGGSVVSAGSLQVSLDTIASTSIPNFVFSDDGNGGTAISFRNTDPITVDTSMPVAVVGSAAQMVSFDQILKNAFGTDQLPFAPSTEFTFSATGNRTVSGGVILNSNATQFWGQSGGAAPGSGIYPSWYSGGSSSTFFSATLAEIQSGGVMFEVGNSIVSTASFSVEDPTGKEITTYHMWGVDPGASSPSSTPSASAEIASIKSFAQYYSSAGLPDVINDNDCPWIGDDIAAGAGMTMPWADRSTDPNANQEGGFWRIAYNGAISGGTVGNDWYQYLSAGDVVRMGWAGGAQGGGVGEHTTSVEALVPTSATSSTTSTTTSTTTAAITVWDDNYTYNHSTYIGTHNATYWDSTVPQTITIYRVDSSGQYLIQGHVSGETILGNIFNDLIQPVGGGAIILAGPGNDEIQGKGADLQSSTVMSFGAGDTFDVTDLAPAGGSVSYDGTSGMLTIGTGSSATTIKLTAALSGMFTHGSDATSGTLVSYIACYCPGTLIAVPGGEHPVERLRIGDMVTTADGRLRPVRWVGRRSYAGRFLAANPGVQPIRFRAGALGGGLPRRDLLVSPEHAMLLSGMLIPARCLVNGDTILRERGRDRVDYVHIELNSHDILLAEGAPSESYLDDGGRAMFHNATQFAALYPDAPAPGGYCAPRVEHGWELDAVRQRLAELRAA